MSNLHIVGNHMSRLNYMNHLKTKPTHWIVRPVKIQTGLSITGGPELSIERSHGIQINMGIPRVWPWRYRMSQVSYGEYSDQTRHITRLIWFFICVCLFSVNKVYKCYAMHEILHVTSNSSSALKLLLNSSCFIFSDRSKESCSKGI